jgi:hypothetical protein
MNDQQDRERAVAYANLLFGTDYTPSDSDISVVELDRVHPLFFEQIESERYEAIYQNAGFYEEFKRRKDVIAVGEGDSLPPEFDVLGGDR